MAGGGALPLPSPPARYPPPVTDRPERATPAWIRQAALSVALVILGVLATLWVANRLRTLLVMVFIALFVSVALEPAVRALNKRGWKRGLATGFVLLAAFLVFGGLIAALVPVFIDQASRIARRMPEYVESLQDFLSRFTDLDFSGSELIEQLEDLPALLQRYGSDVAGGIFAVGNTVFSALFQMLVIGLFAYYMTAEGPKLRRTVLSFLPPPRQREVLRLWDLAVEKTGAYFFSRAILALVSAAFHSIAFSLLGLPSPIALALWLSVIGQFIPVVGLVVGALLPALVALLQSPIDLLWVLVAVSAYQQIENFVLIPKITQRTMAIHPAVSIGSVIAGASLLGGIGAVLALPVAATIQAFVSTLVTRHEPIVVGEPAAAGGDAERRGEPTEPPSS